MWTKQTRCLRPTAETRRAAASQRRSKPRTSPTSPLPPISPIYGRLSAHSFTFHGVLYRLDAGWAWWIWGTGTFWHPMGHIIHSRPPTFGPPHYPGHRLLILCREARNLAKWRTPRLSRASAEVGAEKLAMNVSSKRWATWDSHYSSSRVPTGADFAILYSWDVTLYKPRPRLARAVAGLVSIVKLNSLSSASLREGRSPHCSADRCCVPRVLTLFTGAMQKWKRRSRTSAAV